MPLAALIFDVDGTLAETEDAHLQAFNLTFADFGLAWVWDRPLYRRLLRVAGGKERIRHFIDTGGGEVAAAAVAGNGLDALIRRLHKRKTEHYTRLVATGDVPLRPGIARLWMQARDAGLVLAIATTTTRANVQALLEGATPAGTADLFRVIACSDDAPVKKPAPDVYQYVLRALALPPAVCLAIEDSPNGVRAAVAARVPVVVTESAYTSGDDFAGALAVYPDLAAVDLTCLRQVHANP